MTSVADYPSFSLRISINSFTLIYCLSKRLAVAISFKRFLQTFFLSSWATLRFLRPTRSDPAGLIGSSSLFVFGSESAESIILGGFTLGLYLEISALTAVYS
eukprot:NODE_937_length_3004_cov_0.206196.p2 type:complete len:102 gc:universal NODE_937_length_3004_cov_0.206196:2421-2726(+)